MANWPHDDAEYEVVQEGGFAGSRAADTNVVEALAGMFDPPLPDNVGANHRVVLRYVLLAPRDDGA